MFNNLVKNSFKEASNNKFKDFITEKIILTYHGTFLTERKFNLNSQLNNSKLKSGKTHNVRLHRKNLPPPPKSIQDFNTHPLQNYF